jgi:hypothetical protein
MTIIPYSQLSSMETMDSRDENAMLFGLANEVIQYGFEYVDNIDSADAILTEHISNEYWEKEHLDTEHVTIPKLTSHSPFSLLTSPFGSDDHSPIVNRRESYDRRSPKVTCIAYDSKTMQPIGYELIGAVANENNIRFLTQLMRPKELLAKFNNPNKYYPKTGKGQIGIAPQVNTLDGINYWPQVGLIYPSSPAAQSRIREWDVLLKINDVSMQNIDLTECYRRMQGDVGQQMVFTVWRWPDQVFLDTITMGPRKN